MYQTINYLKSVGEEIIKHGDKPYKELDLLQEIYICSCNYEALAVKEFLENLMRNK